MEKVGAFTDRTTEGGEWRSGNPASGQQATPMLAAYFNMLQRELVGVVEAADLELDIEDDAQLLKAIRAMRGGSGTGFGLWKWNASTAGDPGAGKVSLNNADPSLATQLLVAEVSGESIDYSVVMSTVQAGDTLYLQQRDSSALAHRFKVTGAPVDNGSYRSIPVVYVSGSGGLPGANTWMVVHLTRTTAADASTDGIAGAFSNLKASATGTNATVTVTADSVCVKNAAGQQRVLNGVALAINSASVGANGLDTGALAASTWYSVWVIYNPTTQTVAGLLSLSSTAPTLPAGYTHKARVGWVLTDATASKNPLSFIQYGRCVQFKVAAGSNLAALPIVASGAAGSTTTPTWVSFAPKVPHTAAKAILQAAIPNSGAVGQIIVAPNNSYGGYVTAANLPPLVYSQVAGQTSTYARGDLLIETAGVLYFASSNGNAVVQQIGWEDNL